MSVSPAPVEVVDVLPTPFGGLLLVRNSGGTVELYTVPVAARARRPEPPQGWDEVAGQIQSDSIAYSVVAHVEVTEAGQVREVATYPPLARRDGRAVVPVEALRQFREVVYPLLAAHLVRPAAGGS